MTGFPKPFKGIITPLVTPLKDNDSIDIEGLERLVEHVISGGVSAIFVLGTTGEFASLSYRLRKELIERVCKLAAGRLPVLAGISDSAFAESLNLAEYAKECGVSAVVLTPPFYFSTGQPELLEYLQRLMIKMPLPLFIYNMPVHTKVSFELETVLAAASIPGIIGIKDSSSNLVYINQVRYLLRDHKEFSFLVGPEELLSEYVLSGGHGGVNAGSNLFPKLFVNLYKASVNRDFETIEKLQKKVMQISTTIYRVGKHGSSLIKGLKCSLSIAGICDDFMADPFHRFKEPERRKVQQLLDQMNYRELL